jgi:hypothetical protein
MPPAIVSRLQADPSCGLKVAADVGPPQLAALLIEQPTHLEW